MPSAGRYKRDVRPVQIQRFDPSKPNPALVVSPPPAKKRPREATPEPVLPPPKKKKDKRKKRKEKLKNKKKATLLEGELRKKAPRKAIEAKVEVAGERFKQTNERSDFHLFS